MPVLVQPRLDAKPWGGSRLRALGFHLAGREPLGEVLVTAPEATIATGSFAGLTIGAAAERYPERFVGERGARLTGRDDLFPVLVKLIDAMDDLSLQVHPDDELAHALGEPTGKTEAWHILDAEPGAVIFAGLQPGVEPTTFMTAVRRGDPAAAGLLRRLPVRPGDTYLLPAGCIHALGKGLLVYEVQQPSNTTFRLFDWNRVDHAGRPRPLHIDLGERAIKPELRPEALAPVGIAGAGNRVSLVANPFFALERVVLAAGDAIEVPAAPTPRVLTVVNGLLTAHGPAGAVDLRAGMSALALVDEPTSLRASEPTVLLLAWTPDLPREFSEVALAAPNSAPVDAG